MKTGKAKPGMLRPLVLVASAGFIIMAGFIIYAMMIGNLMTEGSTLLAMPWGMVSLVDIYLGLILFSLWVVWREDFSLAGICWAVLIISLGNMLSCLYILKACRDAGRNMKKFWLGRQLEEL
ncbi:MAG: hypothetical protein ACI909_000545 [Planctomycetota bacterium]|jgi:hypothetical protein